jgi:4-amino-4-deoxy-L-arabinose transferase-like glycosyltransferase
MFVDGVTYASIARNLAEGRGTFWTPSYTATIYPEFYDHPPLGFWLQSLWFRMLGDHLFVERLYSCVGGLLTAWLVAVIWRAMNRTSEDADYDWLPVLFWIAVPVVSWSIVSNLLEVTVSVWTTAAIALVLGALTSHRRAITLACALASGLTVLAACLTKGPIGLFPLAAPFALLPLLPADRQEAPGSRVLVAASLQWLSVVICFGALLGVPAARSSLGRYVAEQVVAAIGGQREVSAGPLTILKALGEGVVLPIMAVAGLIIAATRQFVRPSPHQRAHAGAMLLVGLSGSLPIVVSAKQAGHYLVPSVPFFALAAASLLIPTAREGVERVAARHLSGAAGVATSALLLGAVSLSYWSGLGRDRQRLANLERLATVMPRGATIGICPEWNGDWGLHAWFERRFVVSLDAAAWTSHSWFLRAGERPRPDCPPAPCNAVSDASSALVLMKCSRQAPTVER